MQLHGGQRLCNGRLTSAAQSPRPEEMPPPLRWPSRVSTRSHLSGVQRGASSWHDTSQLQEREVCAQSGQLSLFAGALTSPFSGFPGQEGRKSTIAGTEHLVINHLGAFSFLKLLFDSKPAKCVCP